MGQWQLTVDSWHGAVTVDSWHGAVAVDSVGVMQLAWGQLASCRAATMQEGYSGVAMCKGWHGH